MWSYSQSTGLLTDPSGEVIGTGYSGNGPGLNNPDMQNDRDVGPCPRGSWAIGSFFDDIGGKGPLVAHLAAMDGTETFGRSGFMVHGDNSKMNHSASEGCIILAHPLRLAIEQSIDDILLVTP